MLAASIFAQLALYSLACLGAGAAGRSALMRLLRSGSQISALGRLATDYLLGQGLLSCAWLLLALAGWFSPVAIGSLLVASLMAVAIVSRGDLRACALQLQSLVVDLWRGPFSLTVLAFATVGWALIGFTALTHSLSGDSLNLHMLIPKVVADSHVLTSQFFNFRISYFGLQGEMHHAALLSLGSPEAAKLFSWPTMMAGALMLASVCARCGAGRSGKWLAVLILYTSTGVLWWIGEGKIEVFSTALGLAAVYWLLPGERTHGGLALGGMFTAFAVQAKLAYGLTLVPILALLFLWPHLRRAAGRFMGSEPSTLAPGAIAGLGVSIFAFALAMAPHIVKNQYLFGSIVGVTEAGANLPTFLDESWYGAETRSRIQLLYPLVLTFGEYFAQYGTLSPLVLAFLPLALLLRGDARLAAGNVLLPLSLAPLLVLVPWMIAYPDKVVTRYFLVPLLLWIPLVSVAAENAAFPRGRPEGDRIPQHSSASLAWKVLPWLAVAFLTWRILRLPAGIERWFAGSVLVFAMIAYRDVLALPRTGVGIRLLRFTVPLVAFVVLFSTIWRCTNYLFFPRQTFAYLAGRIGECDWQYDWCRASEVANRIAAPGARLLSTTTYKYFLRADLIQCSSSREDVGRIVDAPTDAAAWSEILIRGFDYVLIDSRDSSAARLAEVIGKPEPSAVVAEALFADGPLTLYKILRRDAGYECRQERAPAWTVVKKESG